MPSTRALVPVGMLHLEAEKVEVHLLASLQEREVPEDAGCRMMHELDLRTDSYWSPLVMIRTVESRLEKKHGSDEAGPQTARLVGSQE